MAWNIEIYEEPGVLMVQQLVGGDEAPHQAIRTLMSEGVGQNRVLLALAEDTTDAGRRPVLHPEPESVTMSFETLVRDTTDLLNDQKPFEAVTLVYGALLGENGDDPEVQLLAASVFENCRLYKAALWCLREAQSAFNDMRRAAVDIRLARALRRSGSQESIKKLVEDALSHEELPPLLRCEGLLVLASELKGEEAIDTLDDLLDLGEEHLGDHRVVAEALELQADLHKESNPKRAESFYLAAGKMLMELKDPYFFTLNERLVVHFIQQKQYPEALGLSQEMFDVLQAVKAPPMAHVPFFVFASHVHKLLGDKDTSKKARKAADDISPMEAERIETLLLEVLGEPATA